MLNSKLIIFTGIFIMLMSISLVSSHWSCTGGITFVNVSVIGPDGSGWLVNVSAVSCGYGQTAMYFCEGKAEECCFGGFDNNTGICYTTAGCYNGRNCCSWYWPGCYSFFGDGQWGCPGYTPYTVEILSSYPHCLGGAAKFTLTKRVQNLTGRGWAASAAYIYDDAYYDVATFAYAPAVSLCMSNAEVRCGDASEGEDNKYLYKQDILVGKCSYKCDSGKCNAF